jgi:hypothetical protein
MPFPPGVQTVTLTGHQTLADGAGRPLPVRIRPVPTRVVSAEHGVVVDNEPVVVRPNDAGEWSVELVAVDAQGFTPSGWTYRVETGDDALFVSLPAALGTVDIADLTPAGYDGGEYLLVQGPPGPTGAEGPAGPPGPPGDPATNLVQSVNGKQGVVVLVAGDVGADVAGAAADAVAAHLAASDPHGDRAYAHATFATIVTVLAIDGFVNDLLTRVQAIEQGTAFLAGANFTAPALVYNSRLEVRDGGGNPLHRLDGATNTAGFFGAAPVGRRTVTGSWSDGTAGQSLAAALAELGLIDDQTSA